MICKYCGYEQGHTSRCPTVQPTPAAKGDRSPVPYSGTELEYDLFDAVKTSDPEYLAAYKAMRPAENGYLPWHQAIELAKKFQPADPTNPRKEFYRELLIAVQEKLGIDIARNPDAIKAYTAVGTPLDTFHSVDAFLTRTENGRESTVTLDASLRREKIEDGAKADEVITDVPDVEEDEDGYLAAIEMYADRVVKHFRQQKSRQFIDAAAEE